VRFIEAENIGQIGKRKVYPVSPAISERFCHKGLAVSLGFLVFAGAFDLVVVGKYGLPYVEGGNAKVEFEAQSYF
jgi:hypothetical protein